MRGGDGIQRYHAWVGLLYTISLLLAFAVGLCLNREPCGIDQSVAPKATSPRPDMSYRAHGVFEVPGFSPPYFRTHLDHRNEILVGKRIDNQSGSHRVGSQEDEVANAQDLCDRMVRNIAGDCLKRGMSCYLPCVANGDVRLELASLDINPGRSNHAREIAALDLVRIDENQVPNA